MVGASCKEPDYAMGFGFTLVAGLATVLGALAVPLIQKYDENVAHKVTSGALGFAAGVMLYVSFVDILGEEAKEFFEKHFTPKAGCGRRLGNEGDQAEEENVWVRINVALFFFLGIGLAMGLDKITDYFSGGHSHSTEGFAGESRQVELVRNAEAGSGGAQEERGEGGKSAGAQKQNSGEQLHPRQRSTEERNAALQRVSLVAFVALTLHKFPEGLATFFVAGKGSFTVPLAIALHNIPEGLAIAVPVYQASGQAKKAVQATFIASMAQPAGAAIGWFMIFVCRVEAIPSFIYGAMYSSTAGIMVCVSLMELLPEAFESASPFFVCCCCFAGFLLMEVSIVMLELAGA